MSGSFVPEPGAAHHRMLFLEAFGQLSRYPDRKGIVAGEEDLYSAFDGRAESMGWSTTSKSRSPRPVFWSVHEAELSAGHGTSRIGWVQVGLETDVAPALALPPLIQCFDDALRRFGVVELSGLQLTASYLQAGTESSMRDLASPLFWFRLALGPRANALIAFDNGLLQGRSEAEFVASLPRMNGGLGLFEFGPLVPVPPRHSIAVPGEAPIDVALSPARLGVSVELPEWSASAAAWVLAVVIDKACAGGPGTRNFAVRLTRVQ